MGNDRSRFSERGSGSGIATGQGEGHSKDQVGSVSLPWKILFFFFFVTPKRTNLHFSLFRFLVY